MEYKALILFRVNVGIPEIVPVQLNRHWRHLLDYEAIASMVSKTLTVDTTMPGRRLAARNVE